ncbi:hypothetical protein PIB30_095426 [Stylosanthes scabra]|uniref:Uncharacterized protein n=1 Tax=Stylosanthes scabra TaxID=79078 RepID=A0ABU6ZUC5_9FABA|nr:hypothetical protein [Stylosanthes scabra]
MTVSLLHAYVTDWWFLNHIDNIALTDTTGKPYPVKRASDNVGLRAVYRRMSSWPALGSVRDVQTGLYVLNNICVSRRVNRADRRVAIQLRASVDMPEVGSLQCPPRICVIPTHMRGHLTLSRFQSICYPSTTHMRAFLRICAGHTHSHPTLHLTQPDHSFPKHSPSLRICVRSYAYAWHTHSPSPLKTSQHA